MYFRLADHGHAFSTRPRGVALLSEVVERASRSTEVVIDFADVMSISYSFADEFVAALLQGVSDETYHFDVRLKRVPTQLRGVMLKSLERRGLQVDPDELFDLAVQ